MLVHLISRFMLHPELVEHYKRLEPNGEARVAFLRDQGIHDPKDIAAILRFEQDPDELHDRLRDQIDAHFARVINPHLRWPGDPITLTQISPSSLTKGRPTTVEAQGFWFGRDPSQLQLQLHPEVGASTSFPATEVSQDPATKESRASFELTLEVVGVYKVTLLRQVEGTTESSQLPRGLEVG